MVITANQKKDKNVIVLRASQHGQEVALAKKTLIGSNFGLGRPWANEHLG